MTDKTKTNFEKLVSDGSVLYNAGKYRDAVKLYNTALIMSGRIDNITLAGLYIKLANAFYKLEDYDKSTYYYEKYLKIIPQGQTSVFSRLAHNYYYFDSDKSIDYHNKALNLEINRYDISCKIFAMTKSAYYTQQDIKDEAEYEISQLKQTIYSDIVKYNHSEKKKFPDKKLTIGYFSSDCNGHTMMNYIIPIWKNHDKSKYNFIIFSCSEKEDYKTEEISKIGIEIVKCSKLSDEELANLIYTKDVDILVDLSGYTHLKSFVHLYKPAPVIISYLGYLNTTGMKEVDYILTDKFTIPEEKQYLYTEKPLYLDGTYQIYMDKKVPPITPCPYKTNGYITFGSFNCSSKINDTVIFLWSEILKKVPNSKLLIYRTQLTKKIIKFMSSKFESFGIDEKRLIFSSRVFDFHYKAYLLADISLDTYPFSGMSIAIETALMGVPTISLYSDGMQSRGASGINIALGLKELTAACGDEYIKTAVELSQNRKQLNFYRENLRKKMENSAIRKKSKEFTLNLELKYEQAWQEFINSP